MPSSQTLEWLDMDPKMIIPTYPQESLALETVAPEYFATGTSIGLFLNQ